MNYMGSGAKASAGSYSRGAMYLHWVVAAFIFFVGGLGLVLEQIPEAGRPYWINMHASVGLVMFGFIVMRVLWRLTHKAPPPETSWSQVVSLASHGAHMLLYVLMIGLPIAGMIAYVFGGNAFDYGLFKLDLGVAADDDFSDLVETIHMGFAYSLMAVVALHIGAALWHHFVARDGIFARILPIR